MKMIKHSFWFRVSATLTKYFVNTQPVSVSMPSSMLLNFWRSLFWSCWNYSPNPVLTLFFTYLFFRISVQLSRSWPWWPSWQWEPLISLWYEQFAHRWRGCCWTCYNRYLKQATRIFWKKNAAYLYSSAYPTWRKFCCSLIMLKANFNFDHY